MRVQGVIHIEAPRETGERSGVGLSIEPADLLLGRYVGRRVG
jgi:hypothetical protein